MFSKDDNMNEWIFTRGFQGCYDCFSNPKGKAIGWLRLFVVAHLFSFSNDLISCVQIIHDHIFIFAHCLMLFLIARVFLFIGREKLEWLHCKFYYT